MRDEILQIIKQCAHCEGLAEACNELERYMLQQRPVSVALLGRGDRVTVLYRLANNEEGQAEMHCGYVTESMHDVFTPGMLLVDVVLAAITNPSFGEFES